MDKLKHTCVDSLHVWSCSVLSVFRLSVWFRGKYNFVRRVTKRRQLLLSNAWKYLKKNSTEFDIGIFLNAVLKSATCIN